MADCSGKGVVIDSVWLKRRRAQNRSSNFNIFRTNIFTSDLDSVGGQIWLDWITPSPVGGFDNPPYPFSFGMAGTPVSSSTSMININYLDGIGNLRINRLE